MTCASIDADLADDCEDQIFGADAIWQVSVDVQRQCSGFALQQTLRGQYMTDLGRADAKGQGAERAMCTRMTVSTNDRLAWLCGSLFRTNNVYDSALIALEAQQLQSERITVFLHAPNLIGSVLTNDNSHIFEACNRRSRC